MTEKRKNPYAGLNALERIEKRLKKQVKEIRAQKAALKLSLEHYKIQLKEARKYTEPGTFSVDKGFSTRKKPAGAQLKKVQKYAEAINALKSRPHAEFKTKDKIKLVRAQEFASHPGGVPKLNTAFVPTVSPDQKIKLEFQARRVVMIDDTGRRFYNVDLPELPEYDSDSDELPDYIDGEIEDQAKEARYFLIQNGEHQIWSMGGSRSKIVDQIQLLMRNYGSNKFKETDPNSHYWGNWLKGLRGYENARTMQEFQSDRRARLNETNRPLKHRARSRGRINTGKSR